MTEPKNIKPTEAQIVEMLAFKAFNNNLNAKFKNDLLKDKIWIRIFLKSLEHEFSKKRTLL